MSESAGAARRPRGGGREEGMPGSDDRPRWPQRRRAVPKRASKTHRPPQEVGERQKAMRSVLLMRLASAAYLENEVKQPSGASASILARRAYSCLRLVWYQPGVFDLPKASADHDTTLAASSAADGAVGLALYLTGALTGRPAAAVSSALRRWSSALMAAADSAEGVGASPWGEISSATPAGGTGFGTAAAAVPAGATDPSTELATEVVGAALFAR